jgi:hypothetical protein
VNERLCSICRAFCLNVSAWFSRLSIFHAFFFQIPKGIHLPCIGLVQTATVLSSALVSGCPTAHSSCGAHVSLPFRAPCSASRAIRFRRARAHTHTHTHTHTHNARPCATSANTLFIHHDVTHSLAGVCCGGHVGAVQLVGAVGRARSGALHIHAGCRAAPESEGKLVILILIFRHSMLSH